MLHSSMFGLFKVNGTVKTISKFAVVFHTPKQGLQALREVLVGCLDSALDLNVTTARGVMLDTSLLARAGVLKGSSEWYTLQLLKGGALWLGDCNTCVVGAVMRFESLELLTELQLPHVSRGFILSASRLLMLDVLSSNFDRWPDNCVVTPDHSGLIALDNGKGFGSRPFDFNMSTLLFDYKAIGVYGKKFLGCLHLAERAGLPTPETVSLPHCVMLHDTRAHLLSLDQDQVVSRFVDKMARDPLITWYSFYWQGRHFSGYDSDSSDSDSDSDESGSLGRKLLDSFSGWRSCMSHVAGVVWVDFYMEKVRHLYPLPDGNVCGIDINYFWANLVRVRLQQGIIAATADLEYCAKRFSNLQDQIDHYQ
eukprot:gene7614-769_t